MSLPGIDIKFDNGNTGTVTPNADGVFGLLASAVAVVDTFKLNTPYMVKAMTDVAHLGIKPDTDNYVLYKWLEKFYEEAGEGTELWLMGFEKTSKVSDWFTPDTNTGVVPAQTLLNASNGKINALFTAFSPDDAYTVTVENGLDSDVIIALGKAQAFGENYTNTKAAPLFTIIEGYAFNGNEIELPVLLERTDNRAGVFIGNTEKRSGKATINGASTSCLAGRLAKIQVQESPGKVKTGALNTATAFIVDTPVEQYNVEALHDKGYITFRTHVRKAGYYITDGRLATHVSDDYHYIEQRRVIDKTYRIAHSIVSDEVLEDFNLSNDGTIDPIYAKDVAGRVESAIAAQMTANGELSVDTTKPNDIGVKAAFDLTNNVAQTNTLKMALKVRPKGYGRYIEVLLGFAINLN